MTIIDLDKAYAILWSARTRSFHFESYAQMVEKNVQAYHNQTGLDYICLGVYESEEVANQIADSLEKERKNPLAKQPLQ